MSREIKFRAWDNKNKVMYPTAIIDVSGNIMGMFEDQQSFFDTGRAEIMQYTGLKDKNGKEIYEGDILSWSLSPSLKYKPFLMTWNELEARFTDYSPKEKAAVIGNIYENPELLEEVLRHE